MPNFLVILADGAVAGEKPALCYVCDGFFEPYLAVLIILHHAAVGHGVAAEILEHKVRVGHAAHIPHQQHVVQVLQRHGLIGEQGAVQPLAQRAADLGIAFKDAHGVVGALAVHPLHGFGAHAEDVDVLRAHLLVNFHVGAVHGAQRERAVHHEFHVAGAAGLLAGCGKLLADLRCRHQQFGGAHIIILNVHHLEVFAHARVAVNEPRQGVDVADDQLGAEIPRRGLGAKEEHTRGRIVIRILQDAVVQHLNVQGVEQLALVLVQALGLHIKNEVWVQLYALPPLNEPGKPLLVLVLHLVKTLAEGRILRKGQKLGKLRSILVKAGANALAEQIAQAGVGREQPAAVRDPVGNGRKLAGVGLVIIMEKTVRQNFAVQLAHPVHTEGQRHAQVGHMHLPIGEDGHLPDAVPLVGVVLEQLFAAAAVQLLQNHVNAGQGLAHHLLRPALQRLLHYGVVGVGHRAVGDALCAVPVQPFLIDQQTHQLGNRQAGVRIVDVEHHFFRQEVKICAILAFEILEGVLQRCGGKEVVLLHAQHLAFPVAVLRVEYLVDDLGHLHLVHGLVIFTAAKTFQVKGFPAAGAPGAQGVHAVVIIAHNGHIIGYCVNGVGVFQREHAAAIHDGFPYIAIEVNLANVLGHQDFPHVAVGQPDVRQFHLLAIHDFLAKQPILIADGAPHGGNVQTGQAVQKTGCQPAKAAVAQRGFGLLGHQGGGVQPQLGKSGAVILLAAKVDQVAVQAAPHQKFHRQVVQALAFLLLTLLTADHPFVHDLVAHGGCGGLV